LIPYLMGKDEPLRDFATSSPPIVHRQSAGTRVTITTKKWSLILAPVGPSSDAEKAEFTMMIDGVRRVLRPYGKVYSELYDLSCDPMQQHDVLDDNVRLAMDLQGEFVELLRGLGAKEDFVAPWLNCRGLQKAYEGASTK